MCIVFSASHIMIKADDTIGSNNDSNATIFSNQERNEQPNNESTNIVAAKKEKNNKKTIGELAYQTKKVAGDLIEDSPVEILAAAAVFGAFFPKLTLLTAGAGLFFKYKEHPKVQDFITTVKLEYSATFNTGSDADNNDQSSTKKD